MTDENDRYVGTVRRFMKVTVIYVSYRIVCCSLVAFVIVTSAVNLDAVLAPALSKFSADHTWRIVAENVRGTLILHFLPVENSATAVDPLSFWRVALIHRPSNLFAVPPERESELFSTSTFVPGKGNLGLEIECLAHFHVMKAEAIMLIRNRLLRHGPEVVFDDLFTVEGVDF